jgi:AraC-like DNA-binding protein
VVSERCKIEVKEELTKLGIHFSLLDLSEVAIMENISTEQSEQLQERLLSVGLELMDNDKAILIERIKNVVIETSHHSEEKVKVSILNYLSEKLGEDYTSLVNLFSDVQGITIYKFLIAHKVEKFKRVTCLWRGDYKIIEISYKLDYISVAHLSRQSKKTLDMTPLNF